LYIKDIHTNMSEVEQNNDKQEPAPEAENSLATQSADSDSKKVRLTIFFSYPKASS
jgi:hypothetical protein